MGPGGQRLRALGRLGGGCWRLCWASGGVGLAAGAGPSEACKEGGELGRRGGELGQQKESPRAENKKGGEKKKKILSFSISSTIFQIPFKIQISILFEIFNQFQTFTK